MFLCKPVQLLLGYLWVDIHQAFQVRKVIQRRQVLYLSIADVQPLQSRALGKGRQVRQIAAIGKLQKLQIFAAGKGCQILDHGAGDDNGFQVRHIGRPTPV